MNVQRCLIVANKFVVANRLLSLALSLCSLQCLKGAPLEFSSPVEAVRPSAQNNQPSFQIPPSFNFNPGPPPSNPNIRPYPQFPNNAPGSAPVFNTGPQLISVGNRPGNSGRQSITWNPPPTVAPPPNPRPSVGASSAQDPRSSPDIRFFNPDLTALTGGAENARSARAQPPPSAPRPSPTNSPQKPPEPSAARSERNGGDNGPEKRQKPAATRTVTKPGEKEDVIIYYYYYYDEDNSTKPSTNKPGSDDKLDTIPSLEQYDPKPINEDKPKKVLNLSSGNSGGRQEIPYGGPPSYQSGPPSQPETPRPRPVEVNLNGNNNERIPIGPKPLDLPSESRPQPPDFRTQPDLRPAPKPVRIPESIRIPELTRHNVDDIPRPTPPPPPKPSTDVSVSVSVNGGDRSPVGNTFRYVLIKSTPYGQIVTLYIPLDMDPTLIVIEPHLVHHHPIDQAHSIHNSQVLASGTFPIQLRARHHKDLRLEYFQVPSVPSHNLISTIIDTISD